MVEVEILSARISLRPDKYIECTKARWCEVMKDYPERFRHHAANLAAHGWDILLIDGRVLITQPSVYRSTELPSGHWLGSTHSKRDDATTEFLATLYELRGRYEGHKRLFLEEKPQS